jgi:beta-glucanase (GH16 family)
MFKNKHIFLILAIALLITSILVAGPIKAAPGDWVLVWSDEFNGTAGGGVDTGNWSYDTGGGGWGNGELENYTNRTQNVYIEQDPNDSNNKYVVLKAIQEAYGGSNYTSGRIKTKVLHEFTYGKFEMRAKLPYGQGIWPAFWMLGNDIDAVSWPACGEIDIMEFVGSTPTKVYSKFTGLAITAAAV